MDLLALLTGIAVDVVKGTVVEVAQPAFAPVKEAILPLLYPWWNPALHEIRLNLAQAAEELRAKDASVREALVRSLKPGEAEALVAGFLRSASQATTEERMKMLAAAAAGVFTPDLESETRSRIARVVEQLEPSDILALRRVAMNRDQDAAKILYPLPYTRSALTQTGCVIGVPTGFSGGEHMEVTPLGDAVLLALSLWFPGQATG